MSSHPNSPASFAGNQRDDPFMKAHALLKERAERSKGNIIFNYDGIKENNHLREEMSALSFDCNGSSCKIIRLYSDRMKTLCLDVSCSDNYSEPKSVTLKIGLCNESDIIFPIKENLDLVKIVCDVYSNLDSGLTPSRSAINASHMLHDVSILTFLSFVIFNRAEHEPESRALCDAYLIRNEMDYWNYGPASSMQWRPENYRVPFSKEQRLKMFHKNISVDATSTAGLKHKMDRMTTNKHSRSENILITLDKEKLVIPCNDQIRSLKKWSRDTDTGSSRNMLKRKNKQIEALKRTTNDPDVLSSLSVEYSDPDVMNFFLSAPRETKTLHCESASEALELYLSKHGDFNLKNGIGSMGNISLSSLAKRRSEIEHEEELAQRDEASRTQNMSACEKALTELCAEYKEASKMTDGNRPRVNKVYVSPDLSSGSNKTVDHIKADAKSYLACNYSEMRMMSKDEQGVAEVLFLMPSEIKKFLQHCINMEEAQRKKRKKEGKRVSIRENGWEVEQYDRFTREIRASIDESELVDHDPTEGAWDFLYPTSYEESFHYRRELMTHTFFKPIKEFYTNTETIKAMEAYMPDKERKHKKKLDLMYAMTSMYCVLQKGSPTHQLLQKLGSTHVEFRSGPQNVKDHRRELNEALAGITVANNNLRDFPDDLDLRKRMIKLRKACLVQKEKSVMKLIERSRIADKFTYKPEAYFSGAKRLCTDGEIAFKLQKPIPPDMAHCTVALKCQAELAINIMSHNRLYLDARFISRIARAIATSKKDREPFVVYHPVTIGNYDSVCAHVLIRGQIGKSDSGVAYVTYLYNDHVFRSEKWTSADINNNSVMHHRMAAVIIKNVLTRCSNIKRDIDTDEAFANGNLHDIPLLRSSDYQAYMRVASRGSPAEYNLRDNIFSYHVSKIWRKLNDECNLHTIILRESSWSASKFYKVFRYFAYGIFANSDLIFLTKKKLSKTLDQSNINKISIWYLFRLLTARQGKLRYKRSLLFDHSMKDIGGEIFLVNLCPYTISGRYSHLSECLKDTAEETKLYNQYVREHKETIYDDFSRIIRMKDVGKAKLKEEYLKHFERIKEFSDLTGGRFTWSPASVVLIQGEISNAGEVIENEFGLSKSMLSIDSLATARSSVDVETMKTTQCIESIIKLHKRLGNGSLLQTCLNILDNKAPIEFTTEMFPKDQTGGEREISIMTASMRVLQASCEDFSRRLSSKCIKNEVLDEKDKKKRMTDILEEVFKKENRGLLTMDQTRWGPNFNTCLFSLMLMSFHTYTSEAYLPATIAFLSEYKIFAIPTDHPIDMISADCGYSKLGLLGRSHMGQGLFHFTSSIYHAMVMNKIMAHCEKMVTREIMKAGFDPRNYVISTNNLITSDDVFAAFTIDRSVIRSEELMNLDQQRRRFELSVDGLVMRRMRFMMSKLWENMQDILFVFGIKTSDYKNIVSREAAEFNSMYISASAIVDSDLKFLYSLLDPTTTGRSYDDFQSAFDTYYSAINSGCSESASLVIAYMNLVKALIMWKIDPCSIPLPDRKVVLAGFPREETKMVNDINEIFSIDGIRKPKSSKFKNHLNFKTKKIGERVLSMLKPSISTRDSMSVSNVINSITAGEKIRNKSILTYCDILETVPASTTDSSDEKVSAWSLSVFFKRAFDAMEFLKDELQADDIEFMNTRIESRETEGKRFIRKILKRSDKSNFKASDFLLSSRGEVQYLRENWTWEDFILHSAMKEKRSEIEVNKSVLSAMAEMDFNASLIYSKQLASELREYKTTCIQFEIHPFIAFNQRITDPLMKLPLNPIKYSSYNSIHSRLIGSDSSSQKFVAISDRSYKHMIVNNKISDVYKSKLYKYKVHKGRLEDPSKLVHKAIKGTESEPFETRSAIVNAPGIPDVKKQIANLSILREVCRLFQSNREARQYSDCIMSMEVETSSPPNSASIENEDAEEDNDFLPQGNNAFAQLFSGNFDGYDDDLSEDLRGRIGNAAEYIMTDAPRVVLGQQLEGDEPTMEVNQPDEDEIDTGAGSSMPFSFDIVSNYPSWTTDALVDDLRIDPGMNLDIETVMNFAGSYVEGIEHGTTGLSSYEALASTRRTRHTKVSDILALTTLGYNSKRIILMLILRKMETLRIIIPQFKSDNHLHDFRTFIEDIQRAGFLSADPNIGYKLRALCNRVTRDCAKLNVERPEEKNEIWCRLLDCDGVETQPSLDDVIRVMMDQELSSVILNTEFFGSQPINRLLLRDMVRDGRAIARQI